jgi:peptide/nickel transport system substrate-binding protein
MASIREVRFNRRTFAAGAAWLVAAATASTACSPSTETPAAGDGSPRPGGTLRVGIQGSSSKESNNPFLDTANLSDVLRRVLLYDAVTKYEPDGRIVPSAASSWEFDGKRTEVRFNVKRGETFSDGAPVTPADVAFSLRTYGQIGFGTSEIPIDWPNVRVDGAQVVAPLLQPWTDVAESLAAFAPTVKDGTTDFAEAPIGSGPFKLDEFSPGSGVARLVPNTKYTEHVFLDAVEIRAFEDTAAMTNALVAGELDVAINVGSRNARVADGVGGVLTSRKHGALMFPFAMRLDEQPFDNPDVRLAMKLAADRQALVDGVLQGNGLVGNDLFMPGDVDYDHALPQRTRDLDLAAKLLTGAGYSAASPLQITLWSSRFDQAMADAATLFVEQLNDGLPMVDAKVELAAADTYWSDVWLKKPFYTGWLQTWPLTRVMQSTLGYSKGAYNETGMDRGDFDAFVETAITSDDPAKRKAALFGAQEIMWSDGGYIVWGYADEIDLAYSHVKGLPTAPGKARSSIWRAWLDR